METVYIGHGKEFIPNFSAFGFGQATCCIFVVFFLFVYDVKRTIFGCTSSAVEFYLSGRSQ